MVNCWPIAGCVPYQGYFNEAKAEAFFLQARQKGYDAYMGGVAAYATLGWFPDPIASPALDRSETSLVELVIHESVHNTIYRPGAAEFNEALANTIAFALVKEFWAQRGVDSGALEAFFWPDSFIFMCFFWFLQRLLLNGHFSDFMHKRLGHRVPGPSRARTCYG